MGRSFVFCSIKCAVLLVAATTRSDVATAHSPVDSTAPLSEAITGTAVQPSADEIAPLQDPFAPFDVWPSESIWPYESLTPEDRPW